MKLKIGDYVRIRYGKESTIYYWLKIVSLKSHPNWENIGIQGFVHHSYNRIYIGSIEQWFHAYSEIKRFKDYDSLKEDIMVMEL